MQHVHDPGADRLHQYLRALALEEHEHVEVAIALGGLGPEFPCNLDDRLHSQTVYFNPVEQIAAALERGYVILAFELAHEFADVFRGVFESAEITRETAPHPPGLLFAEDFV